MIRKIIQINEEKCNGCGACAAACHEGAIQMINGKAKLIRDDYCDGLGDCLPACPTGAITFEEREAAAYDPEAVQLHLKTRKDSSSQAQPAFSGCPGQAPRSISHTPSDCSAAKTPLESPAPQSQLSQWPVQIQLAPVKAPYFQGAHLLIAADCTAYAYAGFHQRFIRNHITLIGCPKLAHGGSLLRRDPACRHPSFKGQWKIYPLAGGDSKNRWNYSGIKCITFKGRLFAP